MPILPLLRNSAFGPEAVQVISEAFEKACTNLGLADRTDPLTELLARKIIEVAQTGERDPERIRRQALDHLGASRSSEPGTRLS